MINKTSGGEGSSNVDEETRKKHSHRMNMMNQNKNEIGQSIFAKNAGIKAAKLNKENKL